MPIQVSVDEARGLVEAVFAEEVTDSEFAEAVDRYFPESYAALPLGLFDLSQVTVMKVSSVSVRDAARRAAQHVDPRVEGGKLAIVAPRDLLFGMARMYEILRGDSPVEVRIFRDRDEAELWLGLASDTARRSE